MGVGRKKAVLKNILVTALLQVVIVIIGFVIPQLFLNVYGAEIHGLTSVIKSVMSFVLLLSAGLNSASTVALYKPLAEKNYFELNSTLNAIKGQYIKISIMYFITIVFTALAMPTFIKDIDGHYVTIMMIMMGLQTVLDCLLISSLRILVQADQKLYIYNIIYILSMIIRGCLQVYLINRRVSAIIVQAIPALMMILVYILLKIYVAKNYTYIDRKVPKNNKALSQRWSAMVHQIAGLVLNNTDILIITIMSGDMVIASIYSVYELVFNQLYNLMTSMFSQSSVASFGNLLISENKTKLNKTYDEYEYIYYFFVSVVYSITAVMILPFVKLYAGGVSDISYVDPILAFLFIVYSLANNLRVPGNTMINAAGMFKETQWRAILEASINLVVSLFLFNIIGIYALVIGSIAAFAYRTTDIILFSNKRILERNYYKTFFRGFKVMIYVLITTILANSFLIGEINNWVQWFVNATIVGIFSILIVGLLNMLTEWNVTKEIVKMVGKRN